MPKEEFKNRPEFFAARKEIGDLTRMEEMGVMPASESERKIKKIARAAEIHSHCLEQAQQRHVDCTQSYQFLMDQVGAAKAAIFTKDQRISAAAKYLKEAEKHGDLPILSKAREVIEKIEDKAAAGEISTQKMFHERRRIKKRMRELQSCFIWAGSAKYPHEQLRREAQCVPKTTNNLDDLLKNLKI